jgi:hypothetical protein
MATLTVKVLEADLRCIEPLMPETFGACEVLERVRRESERGGERGR